MIFFVFRIYNIYDHKYDYKQIVIFTIIRNYLKIEIFLLIILKSFTFLDLLDFFTSYFLQITYNISLHYILNYHSLTLARVQLRSENTQRVLSFCRANFAQYK